MLPIRSRFAVLVLSSFFLAAASLRATPPRQDCHGDPLPEGAVARMGTTRLRHSDGVSHVVYSPNGQSLASLSRDRTLRVWDAKAGRQLQVFQEPDLDYYAVAFSPDSTKLAAAGGDPFHGGNAGLRFFDLGTGKEIRQLIGHNQPAYMVAFSPDGKTLISVSCDQVIRWDTANGQKLTEWKLRSTAALAISPDRATLAWVDGETEDKTIHLSDAATGKELRRLKSHKRAITSVAYSPDGKYLASGNPFEPICLWDAGTGKVVRRLDQHQGGMALKFSADSKTLASASMDGKVRTWDIQTGQEKATLRGYRGWVNAVAFAPDGKTLALAGADSQVIYQWDLASGNELQPARGHHGQIHTLAFSPDGKLLATGAGDWHDNDQGIYLWDVASGKEAHRLAGHLGKVYCLHFSPDGNYLVSGSEKEDIFRIWNIKTGQEQARYQRKGSDESARAAECRVSAVAWSPDGKLLASAHDQGSLLLWDVKTGTELRSFQGHEGIVNAVAFSPDGKHVLSGSVDRTVRLWDVKTGAEQRRFGDPVDSVKCVAFSPDGRLVAASAGDYEGVIHLWDADSGREIAKLPASKARIYQIAFSPDGKLLAGTGADNSLCLWEVATRAERCRFPGHPSGGLAVAFAPDGRTVAAGSLDTTVLVWDLTHCAEAARPKNDTELDQLWSDLGSSDGKVAHRAICSLVSEPEKALKLLQQRLRPFAGMDNERLAKVLNDLDHDRFQVREKATHELAKLGELAEPFLRQTLQRPPSLEVERRVQLLLGKLETSTLAPDQLRVLRGFEVLERVGGNEARDLFETHARQAPAGRLGREAQASLERLTKR
jgi:WD40 repeat protein